MSRSAIAAVVTAVLAFVLYAFDLRGWELVVPGVPVVLALAPLPFRGRPQLRRTVALIAGVLCLAWAAFYSVFGGIVMLPTAVCLLLSVGRVRPESQAPPTLPVCIDELRAALFALVTGRYDEAATTTKGRITADEIETVIADYPYRPTSYPATWLAESHVFEREGRTWDLSVPFWTAEEGRSDLEARFHVSVDDDGRCEVELRDILVP